MSDRPLKGNVGKPGPRAIADSGTARRAAGKTAQAERRRQVAALHLARLPQREIARRLKISEATVSRDLDSVRADLRRESMENLETALLREVAALDADEARLRAKLAESDGSTAHQLRILDRVLRIMAGRWRLQGIDRGDGAPTFDPEREELRSLPLTELAARLNRTLKDQFGIDPPIAPAETNSPQHP